MAAGDTLVPRRWTRVEYDRMVECRIVGEHEDVELLDGVLVVREPQGSRHGAAVAALYAVLARAFGEGCHVRPQLPIALDDRSQPEPDAVVGRGTPWSYAGAHPSAPLLVVEIAETSLLVDRRHKGALYARAGIADYWIVNLPEAVLEVYREPAPMDAAPLGWGFRAGRRLARGASITPLAAPAARIAVADLLPPA
jgi:Uma2 family endonuclease